MAQHVNPWSIRKILLAVDGSYSSTKAAHAAVDLARAHRAELIVLHVVDDQRIFNELGRFSPELEEEAGKILEENGWKYLTDVEKMAQEQWVRTTLTLRHGIPHEVLLDMVTERPVDLIIVGKLGRRGPRRVLTGSVTQRLIDLSDVPVLVVK